MEVSRRKMLEEVMRRLIGGDLAMVWALSTQFGEELTRAITHHLRSLGRIEVAQEEGRLEGLALDVSFWFLDHGAAYDPAGSLPWVWADKPLRSLIAAEVGHRSVDFEVELEGREATTAGVAEVEIDALAVREPSVALLIEAAQIVASKRDAKVHIEYQIQKALGDPSPSHTVADMFGLGAANIRQIDVRTRKKITTLIGANERFQPLKELSWMK